jgi:eukaryotic-like serine/threonine-protein kinase
MGVGSGDGATMETSEVTHVDEPLAVGTRLLDRYVVVERLEKGGTSVVYRGDDERLSRPVCIKVFHTLRKKEGIYRTTYEHFVQEAFALSKLGHPNTLRIYDFGHLAALPGLEADGAPFQVSEFMSGGTLSSIVRTEGQLGHREAARTVVALGGALTEAHDLGIIHRDIKPKNILFGGAGSKRVPKLADFGIAKSVELENHRLRNKAGDTQVVAGKRLLMFSGLWAAPEQLVAEQIGTTVDIYSLALVTIYMLTGRCVFSTNDAVEAYRQRNHSDSLIDAAVAGSDLSQPVIELLKQACSFDPQRRPREAEQFAQAMAEGLLADRRPPTAESEITTVPLKPVPPVDSDSGPREPSRGPPQRLSMSPEGQIIGDRTAYFVPAPNGTIDLSCVRGAARIRLSLVPAGHQLAVHIKGLSCFVRKHNGRPTGAVQLVQPGAVELLGKDRSTVARIEIDHGSPAAGHTVFPVGDRQVAVSNDECPRLVALDFGPGAEILFVYSTSAEDRATHPRKRQKRSK